MAVRNDLTVDFSLSPRIITVASPSAVVTIQDLHDTLRSIEDEPTNMAYDILISSAGKEALGGGVQVGITATLQNAKLAFAARPGPSYVQCTVTGGNLVAVDANGDGIDPIEPTAFTQIVLTNAVSAAVLTAEWTQAEKADLMADVQAAQQWTQAEHDALLADAQKAANITVNAKRFAV